MSAPATHPVPANLCRGEGVPNGLESTENKMIFPGASSTLLYSRYYSQILECTFSLQWYPFDTQV